MKLDLLLWFSVIGFLFGKFQLFFRIFQAGDVMHGEYHVFFIIQKRVGAGYDSVSFKGLIVGCYNC